MDPELEEFGALAGWEPVGDTSDPETAGPPEGGNFTLKDALPGRKRRTAQRYARLLRKTGLVSPVSKRPLTFEVSDTWILRRFDDLVNNEHLSFRDAISRLGGDPALLDEIVNAAPRAKPEDPIAKEVAQAEEDLVREDAATGPLSLILGELEAFRRETTAIIRDLDEERRNVRARLSRIEEAAKRRPAGFWERIKTAVNVLLGRVTVLDALPLPASTSLKKAA